MTSRMSVVGLTMAALWIGLGTGAAFADDWSMKWKNGFRLESPDGKHSLKFGGRLMADFSFVDADSSVEAALGEIEAGNEFRRARLFVSGTIYENFEFKLNYDWAGGDAEPKDVYIGLKGTPVGNVRVGHFHEPFSLEELTSSKYITFMERSLPTIFAPSRNMGIMFHDKFGSNGTWAFGAYRESDGFGISEGDGVLNLTGRVTFLPIEEEGRLLHLGFAATHKDVGGTFRWRQRPEAHLSPRFVDTGSFESDSALILGAELATAIDSFHGAIEVVQVDHDAASVGDPTFSGLSVQAGWFLTGETRAYKGGKWDRTKPEANWSKEGGKGAWELAVRYSTLDLTDGVIAGGELTDITVGLNWYVNSAARIMMNYIRADEDDLGTADFVTLRFQVDF